MCHVPILIVTGRGNLDDKINGLEMGANDYLVKPFEISELVARVDATLRHSSLNLESNPLTRLPGNGVIEHSMRSAIESGKTFSVLFIDLNEFKAYNDYYGFHRGDEVIHRTAEILVESVEKGRTVVGHIGGDDFLILTEEEDAEALCQRIIRKFEGVKKEFYEPRNLEAGFIMTRDRQGQLRSFSLLSIAIGVVSNQARSLSSVGEVAAIGAEVKRLAKRQNGSSFIIDRRKTASQKQCVEALSGAPEGSV